MRIFVPATLALLALATPALAQLAPASNLEDFRKKGRTESPYASVVPACSIELEGNGPGGSTSAVLYVCPSASDLDRVAAALPLNPAKLVGQKLSERRRFDHMYIYQVTRAKSAPEQTASGSN